MTAHRLIHHADAIAQTNAAVKLHHRRLLGRAGVTVTNTDRDCLLQPHNVMKIGVLLQRIKEALLDRPWIAEHVMNVVGKKLLDHRKASRFTWHSLPLLSLEPSAKNNQVNVSDVDLIELT